MTTKLVRITHFHNALVTLELYATEYIAGATPEQIERTVRLRDMLNRISAAELQEFDALRAEGYVVEDCTPAKTTNNFADMRIMPNEFPSVIYLMRKPDEQASAAPIIDEPPSVDHVTPRFNGVHHLIKTRVPAAMPPLDESEIRPIDPEQLRAEVEQTEAFIAWKLVGGEGLPPEGFKAEYVEPVETEDGDAE